MWEKQSGKHSEKEMGERGARGCLLRVLPTSNTLGFLSSSMILFYPWLRVFMGIQVETSSKKCGPEVRSEDAGILGMLSV